MGFNLNIIVIALVTSDTVSILTKHVSNIPEIEDDRTYNLISVVEKEEVESHGATDVDIGLNMSYQMPKSWQTFCGLEYQKYVSEFTPAVKLTVIECNVTESTSGIWTMGELRQSLSEYNGNVEVFGVSLFCENESVVFLSRPFKVLNLYMLIVRGCTIRDYHSEMFNTNITRFSDSLRYLELKHNVIETSVNLKLINATKMYNCTHENTIEYQSFRDNNFHFFDFFDFVNFSIDSLQNNIEENIRSQPPRSFCNFKHLLTLDEGFADMAEVYHLSDLVVNARYPQLVTFNYSGNYLNKFEDTILAWTKYFPKLQTFDLSHNRISRFNTFNYALDDSNKTTTIDLQYNDFTSITVEDVKNLQRRKRTFLNLRNNPLNCTCTDQLRELLQFIKDGKHVTASNSKYKYLEELRCHSPVAVAQQPLSQLIQNRVCDNEDVTSINPFLIMLVSLGCLIIAGIAIVCVCRKHRIGRKVQRLCYIHFHSVICPSYFSRDSEDAVYDAFVSYSSSDESLVDNYCRRLESLPNRNYKFCIHSKDFVPGISIVQNMETKIESCRDFLLFLSSDFYNSDYCMYEFNESYQMTKIQKGRSMIFILINENALSAPPKIKQCLDKFTYINYDDPNAISRTDYALSRGKNNKHKN